MNKTASLVMKIIGASLALAATVCLIIGCWTELCAGFATMKQGVKRVKRPSAEVADYADEALYE